MRSRPVKPDAPYFLYLLRCYKKRFRKTATTNFWSSETYQRNSIKGNRPLICCAATITSRQRDNRTCHNSNLTENEKKLFHISSYYSVTRFLLNASARYWQGSFLS